MSSGLKKLACCSTFSSPNTTEAIKSDASPLHDCRNFESWAASHITFRVYLQVSVVWLYQGEKLRNKTLACTMFMPLQRVFLAALMALIPVKESFCTTCSGRYVAHFTAKIMFAVSYLPTGISLSAV